MEKLQNRNKRQKVRWDASDSTEEAQNNPGMIVKVNLREVVENKM